ncbi:MAG: sugar phosphate isomerase/epimerase [bacterium (Candidatus Ratteibacteria) CG_4_10_14_3_um_filter_41_18]|uniref:Sugar phosphate isomerase/epimerase n=4 Tax=Candidatus Ratteibacteria TaxID=2979319 RepID=A0A2M7YGR6_9BACT|nr:MAG: xylose isomerase [Candidatus Omnitrophica bacterium CG1_02_41_171]PIV63456.1 MAG: sugar phosphate isomerase/epimerase [bacterium (Candidatus Ratteibacteria) CG01_land_8_20_14_3_00_40_19]PIW32173.1 MAG: sugar phosphate isomerase/epimerase [bacterium (Candidatus Ratteibacteria) CG15_BIG_FIL_POST_REV_8_21_14_020_41_12]PIW74258.1 MAG: sugar phosphate isomerase/epimerase [bacterium (Candidatus Ratteibacteria) CG_4_8_14_3_um_filter_41_36]PIX77820.1 MAG: sugar phosphate isomerase/epimerase [ba
MVETVIGAQLYTLRDYLKTPEDIAETLKQVREIGYSVVQLSGLGPIEPKDLRKILDGEGLYPCSTHTGYEKIIKETQKVIEEHKILGAPIVVCPGLPSELHNGEGYKKVALELSRAGEIFVKNGLSLAYHNHGIEFEKYGDKIGLEILYAESNPEYLQAEIDTYWVQYGGGDPAEWCNKMKGRLPVLHLKDMGIKDNKPIMMEVGEGNLNWEAIIKAAQDAGTKWYLVEQDICQRPPIESLKISLENMKKMGLS